MTDDKLSGVLAALVFYLAAAQKAAAESSGPGSFAIHFLDALYNLQEKAEVLRAGLQREEGAG